MNYQEFLSEHKRLDAKYGDAENRYRDARTSYDRALEDHKSVTERFNATPADARGDLKAELDKSGDRVRTATGQLDDSVARRDSALGERAHLESTHASFDLARRDAVGRPDGSPGGSDASRTPEIAPPSEHLSPTPANGPTSPLKFGDLLPPSDSPPPQPGAPSVPWSATTPVITSGKEENARLAGEYGKDYKPGLSDEGQALTAATDRPFSSVRMYAAADTASPSATDPAVKGRWTAPDKEEVLRRTPHQDQMRHSLPNDSGQPDPNKLAYRVHPIGQTLTGSQAGANDYGPGGGNQIEARDNRAGEVHLDLGHWKPLTESEQQHPLTSQFNRAENPAEYWERKGMFGDFNRASKAEQSPVETPRTTPITVPAEHQFWTQPATAQPTPEAGTDSRPSMSSAPPVPMPTDSVAPAASAPTPSPSPSLSTTPPPGPTDAVAPATPVGTPSPPRSPGDGMDL